MKIPEFSRKLSEFSQNPEFFEDLSFSKSAQKKSLSKDQSENPVISGLRNLLLHKITKYVPKVPSLLLHL